MHNLGSGFPRETLRRSPRSLGNKSQKSTFLKIFSTLFCCFLENVLLIPAIAIKVAKKLDIISSGLMDLDLFPRLLAQTNLGDLYYIGQGVPQNYVKAAHWYRLAANQGDADAQSLLGVLYYNGQGVPQNYVKAAHWYRLAANQGDADAQSFLGDLYYNGQGVPQDYVKAYKWFILVKAQSRLDAKTSRIVDLLRSLMTTEQIAEGQRLAREWVPSKK